MTLSALSEPLSASTSLESGELIVRSMSSHLVAMSSSLVQAATPQLCHRKTYKIDVQEGARSRLLRPRLWPARAKLVAHKRIAPFLCFQISTFPRFCISHSRFLVPPTRKREGLGTRLLAHVAWRNRGYRSTEYWWRCVR